MRYNQEDINRAAHEIQNLEDLRILEDLQAKLERKQRKFSLKWLLLAFLSLILLYAAGRISANTGAGRFLLKSIHGHGYLWEWSTENPLIYGEAMCWNELVGICEPQWLTMPDGTAATWEWRTAWNVQWRYELFMGNQSASIYEADFGCWVYWWQPEHDSAGNPHIAAAYWISCPES